MSSPETMRCLGCGYDLRGLPENRCPECGRGFDPEDTSTFDDGVRFPSAPLVWALLGVLGVVWGFLGFFAFPTMWTFEHSITLICFPILGWLSAGHSLSICVEQLRKRRWARRGRATLTIAIDLAALFPLFMLALFGIFCLLVMPWL